MGFSEETLKLLRDAGWSEDYHCENTGIVNPFDDFPVANADQVIEFLTKFGGLTIGQDATPRPFNPFPIEFFKFAECNHYSHFAERLNYEKPLYACVIGTSHSGHINLFMTHDGRVYGHYDDPLWKFGDSGIAAVSNLCLGRILKSYE